MTVLPCVPAWHHAFPDAKSAKHRAGYADDHRGMPFPAQHRFWEAADMSAADVRHEERDRLPADDGGGTAEARPRTRRAVVNWILALLTIPGAAAVVAFAYLQVLSTAACTAGTCRLGPSEFVFGLIMYGSPVVAAVAIALSFVTARRPRGFLVPAIAWVLLVIAFAILALTFNT
jgi:hypothetical protein